jgi:hypothetical protein
MRELLSREKREKDEVEVVVVDETRVETKKG